uniref:Tektin n=2 Tax=Mesocestoides corti TaxID=53468 RepID=A0A5K3F0C1_MESCO
MASISKNPCKFKLPDWFINSSAMSCNSLWQRDVSENIRQDTRALRLSSQLRTKWDNYHNTTRLADRLDMIEGYKDILEFARTMLDEEIEQLSSAKEAMEKQIQDMQVPEDCNIECLTIRDRRRGIDFAKDKAEIELRKEQDLLFESRKRLQRKVDEALKQLLQLQEARQMVLKDLQDKNETFEIDAQQYKLTKDCPGVSFKVNPTRIPDGTTTLKQWENFTKCNFQRAESEVKASQRLCNAIFATMKDVENSLDAQGRAADFALRQRTHEDELALDELKWRLKKTEEEIEEMINDLDKLELEMQSEAQMMKLAQTRLERRTYRPGADLCRDQPQYGLTDEVNQLNSSRNSLLYKQAECRHQLHALEATRNRLKEGVAIKENSLRIDTNCLELRKTRMNGSGRYEGLDEVNCAKLMAGHPTGDEAVCEATRLDKVPTYTKLDAIASACALENSPKKVVQ